MSVSAFGYIGSTLFAICGAPQALQCMKQGHAIGISSLFLGMWGAGELLMTIYTLGAIGINFPLLINYGANLIFVGVIAHYKLFPRRRNRWDLKQLLR